MPLINVPFAYRICFALESSVDAIISFRTVQEKAQINRVFIESKKLIINILRLEKMSVENPAKVPDWIKAPLFEPVFREKEKHFRTIKTFAAEAALNPGENYATIMLRINAELELTGNN